MRIRTRIIACFAIVVAAGFAYLLNWVRDDLRPRYLESLEESMVDMANVFATLVEEDLARDRIDPDLFRKVFDKVGDRPISARIYDLVKTNVDIRVYMTDAQGIVIFDSDGGRAEGEDYLRWNDVSRTLDGRYGARSTRSDPDDPRTSVLHIAAPIRTDGEIAGVLTVCKPTVSSNQFIAAARHKVLVAGTVAGLVVILLGIATTAWITRPIEKLTRYAKAIRDGKRTPLPNLGHTELRSMGQAMEEMRTALAGKEYVEQYIQTLTHEVKAPLTAIRGAVELLHEEDLPADQREKFLGNLSTETERIQRIVDRQLLLSSLENRQELRDPEALDIAALVDDVAESLRLSIPAGQVTLEVAAAETAVVIGERFLVRHAVQNLVQNAIEFTPPGGRIQLSVRSDSDAVYVECKDRGSGIPDYATERIFERFYSLPRPESGRKSSGLGLPFVKEVASLHGGWVTLENRPEGGARAILRLAKS